jgi:hypothetical protein
MPSLEKLIASPSSLYKQTLEHLNDIWTIKGQTQSVLCFNLVESVVSGPDEVEYYKLFHFFSFCQQQSIELYVMDSSKKSRLSECNNILVSF